MEKGPIYRMCPRTHEAAVSCHHYVAPYTESPINLGPAFAKRYPLSNKRGSSPRVFYFETRDQKSFIGVRDRKYRREDIKGNGLYMKDVLDEDMASQTRVRKRIETASGA